MVDIGDLKSPGREAVRVRLPPALLFYVKRLCKRIDIAEPSFCLAVLKRAILAKSPVRASTIKTQGIDESPMREVYLEGKKRPGRV